MEQGFCAKDNRETPVNKGCLHPGDFCQHRQACIIHFLEQENRKKGDREKRTPGGAAKRNPETEMKEK